jgi:alkylation response protein AidB-like acyl-CoA dehydrogenase
MTTLPAADLADELQALVESADRFFADHSPASRVRDYLHGDQAVGFDRALWREQAELGWTGIAIPEALGGAGLGIAAAGRLIEVSARRLVPEPFLSTVCLATPVLTAFDCERAQALIRDVAAGTAVIAVAVPSSSAIIQGTLEVEATSSGSGWRLGGRAFALDVPGADRILVPVAVPEGCRWLTIDAPMIPSVAARTLIDGRRGAELDFDGLEVEHEAALGSPVSVSTGLEPILVAGASLVSAWLLGLAEQVFAVTLEYLKAREQFGAVIGSYQALQHRAARLFCELAVARSVLEEALEAVDRGDPDAALLASAAKARTGELALRVASEGIQLHGGVGMTDEANVGLYFKAARVADLLAGHHLVHKSRAAALLGITVEEQPA